MAKRELKNNKKTDLRRPDDRADLSPNPPRDPIKPDPMKQGQVPSVETEPKPDRPDLDWSEHED